MDPNTIDNSQEEEEVVPIVRANVVIKELIEMSKNIIREALYKALTFYISAYINLIFS